MDELATRAVCHVGRGCDDQSTKNEAIFLILSNLAFALPAWVAWTRRFFVEAAFVTVLALVSALYHLCAGDIWCVGGVDCNVLRVVDHQFAYVMVHVVLLNFLQFDVLHNALYWRVRNEQLRHEVYKRHANGKRYATVHYTHAIYVDRIDGGVVRFAWFLFLWVAIALNGVLAVRNPTDSANVWINALYGLVVVVLKLFAIDQFTTNWRNYRWWFLVGAVVFAAAGLVAFYYDSEGYWWLHSLWHIAIAVAVAFFFWLRKGLAPIVETAEPLPLRDDGGTLVTRAQLKALEDRGAFVVRAIGRPVNRPRRNSRRRRRKG
jgi:hypothetical protein